MVAIYFGGAISVGGKSSYYSALVSCALMLGYFLIVNLMRTKEWILRCFKAMVASATIVSCMAIVQYIFGRLNRSTLDLRYFSNIKGRVTVIFGNANLLGFYLAMVFPLALYFLLQTSGLKKKILPFCSCLAFLFAIVFTWSRGAWLALLVSLLVFLLIYTRKTLRYLVLLLLATPLAVFWLPDSVRQRFLSIGSFSDSSVAYRLYTWKGTWQAIKEYFVSGVGYGDEAYAQIYPAFAYSGMETAPHSHNLFLQILFSLGIFGLLIFLVIAFLFIQRNLENIKSTKDRSVRFLNTALLCSGISVFTMGLFDYVWYHYRVFFLFWILLGLSAALSRVDRAEQYRKNLLDIPDPQSASVDIAL